ncbi:MAG: hypothetical protein K8R02_08090 [Anaerohalosphaeraceae bacterium]|nr:hypothetical protein [Anaerohalosphaeraceae bacterium]
MFTSTSATEVLINKIVEIPEIYPRFEVDQGRIELFYEHMQCGQEFPPVNIVKDESNKGCYVLLGGKHRLEAWRRSGKRKIKAFRMTVEKRHWRLAAASLNAMSSKPLKGEELRKVIQDAWEIDGIRDAEEIAHKLNCSERYVRKILKPVRDAEKEKLKKEVVQLRKEGLSLSDIGNRISKPKTTVQSILEAYENGTVPFSYGPKSEENSSNLEKIPPNSCTITAESGKSDENSSIPDKPPAADNSDQPKLKSGKKEIATRKWSETEQVPKRTTPKSEENSSNSEEILPNSCTITADSEKSDKNGFSEEAAEKEKLKETDVIQNGTCSEMNHPKTERNTCNSETIPEPEIPTEKAVSAPQVEESTSDTPSEPFSAIPDLTEFAGEEGWKPGEKTCLRAMELVRAKWNVKAIARKLDKTEVWVRSTAVALIAVYQSKTDKHPHQDWTAEKIAQGLVIADDRVIYLTEFVRCWLGILPDREITFYWIQENLPVYQNFTHVPEGSLLNIMSLEAVYRRSVREGKQPPWEKENPPRLDVIPPDIIDRSAGARTLFYDMADSVHQGLFDDIIKDIIERFNWFIISVNDFKDALVERGKWPELDGLKSASALNSIPIPKAENNINEKSVSDEKEQVVQEERVLASG